VEDHRRLIGVPEQQLLEHIDHHGHRQQTGEHDADLGRRAELRKLLGRRPHQILDEAHRDEGEAGSQAEQRPMAEAKKK